MKRHLIKTSKFLSRVLRHAPEIIGLQLDEQGWADVDELIGKTHASGRKLDLEMLQEIVATNDKQRYSFSEDGTKIRANQGHSLNIDLGLSAIEPPAVLYHGTTTRFLDSILAHGLRSGSRNHVHLSPDHATAVAVGSRHGTPVVLQIDAAGMHREGHAFYLSKNNVWLTERVPPEFISINDENEH